MGYKGERIKCGPSRGIVAIVDLCTDRTPAPTATGRIQGDGYSFSLAMPDNQQAAAEQAPTPEAVMAAQNLATAAQLQSARVFDH